MVMLPEGAAGPRFVDGVAAAGTATDRTAPRRAT
jgi:hypothetical protein